MTAAIYARCSSEESAAKGLTIADQVARCKARADELGLTVLREFKDEGYSAGVGARERRPAFERMIAEARDSAFHNIICLDTSRFSRDPIEAETFERLLEKRGVKLIYVHLPDAGPYSEIIRNFFRNMDRFHSIASKIKAHQGMERIVREGYRAGGPAPYGYRLQRHPMGTRPDGSPYTRSKLEPDDSPSGDVAGKTMAEVMQEYFARRAAGEGRKSIIHDFEQRGIKTRHGRPWNVSTLVSVEDNIDVYLGHTVWNKREKNAVDKDPSELVRIENTHPALISDTIADQVRSRRRRHTWRQVRRDYAFSGGILQCGHCGEPFFGSNGYYRCRTRFFRGKAKCPGESIKADTFEAAIIRIIQEVYDEDVLSELVERHMRRQRKRSAEIRSMTRELADARAAVERWEYGYSVGEIDLKWMTKSSAPYRRRMSELEAQIEQAEALQLSHEDVRRYTRMFITNLPENPQALSRFVNGLTLYPLGDDKRRLDIDLSIRLKKHQWKRLLKDVVEVSHHQPLNSITLALVLHYYAHRRYTCVRRG